MLQVVSLLWGRVCGDGTAVLSCVHTRARGGVLGSSSWRPGMGQRPQLRGQDGHCVGDVGGREVRRGRAPTRFWLMQEASVCMERVPACAQPHRALLLDDGGGRRGECAHVCPAAHIICTLGIAGL